MRVTTGERATVLWISCLVLALVGVGLSGGASVASAEQVEPDYAFEGWFSRIRPNPPIIPSPSGDVSPGQVFPSPQATDGSYVVSSAGGPTGPDGGDNAWIAIQWDTLDAVGATGESFVVTLTKSPSARGDAGTPVIRACNIVVGWAAAEGANAWEDRPVVDCSSAVVPKVDETKYTFDLSGFVQSWLDNTGFGMAIVPGDPADPRGVLEPFQISFAGYDHPDEAARPKAEFVFTPASDDFGGGFGGGGFGGGDFGDSGSDFGSGGLDPVADIDIFPEDVGSPPDPFTPPAVDPVGSGGTGSRPVRGTPIGATDHGLSMWLLLMLPLLGAAVWSTGTALGPAGDPIPVRRGGLSALLEERRAARSGE